ncbi:MAG TPA: amidase family protein [Solirubrobacter sp.]|nr:amidase family protein [Solirubrobacter sp.]
MHGAAELAKRIRNKELTPRESVDHHLARIAELNPKLNALTRTLDEPLTEGPLAGIPFSVKENIDLAGTPTTFGLNGDVPNAPHDAPHVAHLRAAGAVPIARGNLPDLALRWHTESARYGTTVNPLNPDLSPGGSSGGDAVAVAAGMVAFAVGSDYGGSLRVPASLTGVYALRPTPGRFPMAPAAPPSMSRQLFATDGLLARSVEDLELLAPIMAQPDSRDPRYTPMPWGASAGGVAAPRAGARDGGAAPLDVAVLAGEPLDPAPAEAMRRATAALQDAGHRVHETPAPHLEELAQLWIDLLAYDTGAAALPVIRERGCANALTALEGLLAIARPLDGAAYAQALARRHVLAADWSQHFARTPVFVAPVSVRDPWPVGHDLTGIRDQWWGFRVTVAANTLGLPGVAVPLGIDDRRRPLAVQLLGARWDEPTLLAVARDLTAA